MTDTTNSDEPTTPVPVALMMNISAIISSDPLIAEPFKRQVHSFIPKPTPRRLVVMDPRHIEEASLVVGGLRAAIDQAASDRATLERVRAIPAKVDERGRLYIAEADLDAALRDEQEGGVQ